MSLVTLQGLDWHEIGKKQVGKQRRRNEGKNVPKRTDMTVGKNVHTLRVMVKEDEIMKRPWKSRITQACWDFSK